MIDSARNRLRIFALVVFVTLLVSGCAGNEVKTDPAVERAKLRWSSILSGDLDTAYSLYSPGYRSTHSRVDFEIALRMQRVQWTSADYVSHDCAENRCVIRFNVGFSVKKPVPGMDVFKSSNLVEDIWVLSKGEWWFVPQKK